MSRVDMDRCSTKYCRGEVAVVYLGRPLCQGCYERVCDMEDQEYEKESCVSV